MLQLYPHSFQTCAVAPELLTQQVENPFLRRRGHSSSILVRILISLRCYFPLLVDSQIIFIVALSNFFFHNVNYQTVSLKVPISVHAFMKYCPLFVRTVLRRWRYVCPLDTFFSIMCLLELRLQYKRKYHSFE